jgi:uncharacterized protein
MKKRLLISVIMLFSLSMILAACGGKTQLALVTGGTGGTYYPLGGNIAGIISDNTDAEVTAQSSNASVDNMKALENGDADIAFTQTDIASYAAEGKLMFEDGAITNIQAIGTLYPETIQIVTLKESGIETVEDLKGKKVSVGAPGSGTYANAEQIFEIHGMTFDEIDAQPLAFDESTDGLQDGNIDAAFITAGAPTGAVDGLAALKDVNIVPIEQDKIDALISKYPYYAEDTVPAGTYKLEGDVPTVAVQAMLVVSDELEEDLVYEMTKSIFENSDQISHAKGELVTAESAVKGVGIDYHPGAAKYFQEKGLLD